jgi:hypothetical protein
MSFGYSLRRLHMNEQTQRGIAALKAGDRAAARQLLREAVRQNPDEAVAWLWLSGAVESDQERISCLQHVLRIDPGNIHAARGLAQIVERRTKPAPVQPQAEPVEETHPVREPVISQEPQEVQEEQVASEIAPPEDEPIQSVEEERFESAFRISAVQDAREQLASDPRLQEEELLSEEAQLLEERPPAPPLSIQAAAPAPPASTRSRKTAAQEDPGQMVFRTRPSLVPALLAFWVFFFGAVLIARLLRDNPEVSLPLALGLGVLLELVVLFVIIRNYSTRYVLTTRQLSLPFKGRRVKIPLSSIQHAEERQSTLQGIIGVGDVMIDAAVGGQLVHLRMRDVPEFQRRMEQLQKNIKAQA